MFNLSQIFIIFFFHLVQNTEIEFQINRVPSYYTPINDDIFIAGTFNNWSPNDSRFKLNKVTHDTYKINIDLSLGNHQFKFTRGSWDKVETNLDGSSMSNRNLDVSTTNKISVPINIANWDDMKGVHTASGLTRILDTNFPYPQFARTKRIWIYLPPDYYSSTKNYCVIYMSDGQNVFDKLYSTADEWGVDEWMESFYQQGKQTCIVVALETKGVGIDPNGERLNELTPFANNTYGGGSGDLYIDFLVNNVKPYIDTNFRTKPQREFTSIFGSSLGGLMSFYGGLKYQNIFSKIGSFSPSFWFSDKIYEFARDVIRQYDDIKIYFVSGGKETNVNVVPNMVKMANQLHSQGYNNLRYLVELDGQHSEWFWNREFPKAYEWLFLM